MSLTRQNYSVNYIYNGPHTIVSTMPSGYSMTVQGIKGKDDKQQDEEHQSGDYIQQDSLKYYSR